MKIFLSALLVTSSTAFLHSAQVRSGTTLRVQSRGDSSKVTSEALETTKLHGTSSIIAKVAWDIVEEINASDNSVAWKPGNKDAKLSGSSLNIMKHSVRTYPAKVEAMKLSSTERMQEHKSIYNPILERAVGKAEIATEWWGTNSAQARLAWEIVEDIAANDMSEVMKGAINDGDECLVEMIETCQAMKELERVLFVAKKAKENQ